MATGEKGFVQSHNIRHAPAVKQRAHAIGQLALIFGVGRLAGEKLGGQGVAGGQCPVEARKPPGPAQGVAINDAVANLECDPVAGDIAPQSAIKRVAGRRGLSVAFEADFVLPRGVRLPGIVGPSPQGTDTGFTGRTPFGAGSHGAAADT